MASRSDRRWFLKLLPQAAIGAAAVASVPAIQRTEIETVKVTPHPEWLNLGEQECLEIANASAICFGLKPRTMRGDKRNDYKDMSKLGA